MKMLQIENKDKFGKVIADALSSIEQNVTDAQTEFSDSDLFYCLLNF
jgi:hypothetical protein